MKNAHGEGDVKGLVFKRDSLAVIELKFPFGKVRGGSLHYARGDVDAVKLTEMLAYVARHEPDPTSKVENAALLQVPELPIAGSDELIGLDANEEVMALPSEVNRLLDFRHIALFVFLKPHASSEA